MLFCLGGGPILDGSLAFGRGLAQFRVVKLRGLFVRTARNNVADLHDGCDVFMYRDSSIAPWSDL